MTGIQNANYICIYINALIISGTTPVCWQDNPSSSFIDALSLESETPSTTLSFLLDFTFDDRKTFKSS